MKFSIKGFVSKCYENRSFFSKCYEIRSFLQIWSHLLKKSLMENFIFCAAFIKVSRSSRPKVFLRKGVLKICSKFTEEHTCRSVISISVILQSNFIEITLRHGCSPVNLLHIFRTPFLKNTSRWLLLSTQLQ